MKDQEKLRMLADWFDIKDKEAGNYHNDEVQKDLRRIAERITELEELYEKEKNARIESIMHIRANYAGILIFDLCL